MTSEKRVQKSHTDDVSLPSSGWCFWLVVPRRKFASTNKKHQYGIYALVSQTSFCGETSDGVAKCRLFFLGYLLTDLKSLAARKCYYSGDLSLEILQVMLWSWIVLEQDCCFSVLKLQKPGQSFYVIHQTRLLKQKIAYKKYNELWALFDCKFALRKMHGCHKRKGKINLPPMNYSWKKIERSICF